MLSAVFVQDATISLLVCETLLMLSDEFTAKSWFRSKATSSVRILGSVTPKQSTQISPSSFSLRMKLGFQSSVLSGLSSSNPPRRSGPQGLSLSRFGGNRNLWGSEVAIEKENEGQRLVGHSLRSLQEYIPNPLSSDIPSEITCSKHKLLKNRLISAGLEPMSQS
jgi:hypothetical protein